MRKSGAERISPEAAEELRRTIEDAAMAISRQAVTLAGHAGRHTVMGADIKLAAKTVIRS
ncbi:MAG: NFYB/HAP3 family transcription factor subunit [Thaumarchaeota archaeon]|nr:NFYB/HAP3 family transcription factor subunit [Nitrososphaerota archaeon]